MSDRQQSLPTGREAAYSSIGEFPLAYEMQDHRYSFEIDATPEELWRKFFAPKSRGDVIQHRGVRIEILHPGDERGEGLVRHCHFPVPWYLISGGRAMSWEWITEVKPCESWRYDGVGKPLWSKATGWTRLEQLDGGHTRVHFRETYHVFNPILRVLFERAVHRFISKDNDVLIKESLEHGLELMRAHETSEAG